MTLVPSKGVLTFACACIRSVTPPRSLIVKIAWRHSAWADNAALIGTRPTIQVMVATMEPFCVCTVSHSPNYICRYRIELQLVPMPNVQWSTSHRRNAAHPCGNRGRPIFCCDGVHFLVLFMMLVSFPMRRSVFHAICEAVAHAHAHAHWEKKKTACAIQSRWTSKNFFELACILGFAYERGIGVWQKKKRIRACHEARASVGTLSDA